MLTALILDLDGTLVDTNRYHVDAFIPAFEEAAYGVARGRIDRAVGMGGDQLIADVLGEAAEREHGDAMRTTYGEAFERLAREHDFALFPGALDLIAAAKERGLKVALATSSGEDDLETIFESAGTDLRDYVDVVTTKSDVDASKPAADVIVAVLDKLGVAPTEAALVGDTRYDFEACTRVGVAGIGVTTWIYGADALVGAGARIAYDDVADLLAHLDEALHAVSPGSEALTADRLETMMDEALAEARRGAEAGEVPIGAVVARWDGTAVARGHNEAGEAGTGLAHAELLALQHAAVEEGGRAEGLVLITTLEPCAMCLGAAVEAGIDTVVYALAAPPNGATGRLRNIPGRRMPRVVGGVKARASRALLEEWLTEQPSGEGRFVRGLLMTV
jgi:phosphoglycolate phosphatase-like HAD superfamily hydrolase/tRNA(Arg) A34 adenosine deaminase TadA